MVKLWSSQETLFCIAALGNDTMVTGQEACPSILLRTAFLATAFLVTKGPGSKMAEIMNPGRKMLGVQRITVRLLQSVMEECAGRGSYQLLRVQFQDIQKYWQDRKLLAEEEDGCCCTQPDFSSGSLSWATCNNTLHWSCWDTCMSIPYFGK